MRGSGVPYLNTSIELMHLISSRHEVFFPNLRRWFSCVVIRVLVLEKLGNRGWKLVGTNLSCLHVCTKTIPNPGVAHEAGAGREHIRTAEIGV